METEKAGQFSWKLSYIWVNMLVYWDHYYISFQLFLVQIALFPDAISKLKIYFSVSLSLGDGLSSNQSLLYSGKIQ